MTQPEDTFTLELPLPVPDVIPPAVQSLPDDIEYGDVARSMMGLPPAQPKPRALPAWRMALNAAIAADPAGKKGVADRLEVSRPYVSRITTGHIAKASPKFIERVVAVYLQVDCPALQRTLPPAECRAYADRTYAQISQFEVDHWRACRGCANNHRRNAELAAAERARITARTTTKGETA